MNIVNDLQNLSIEEFTSKYSIYWIVWCMLASKEIKKQTGLDVSMALHRVKGE